MASDKIREAHKQEPMTTLLELSSRLEEATGLDWRLDLDLSAAFVWLPEWRALKRPDGHYEFRDSETADFALEIHKDWTASVDAALALVERMLPGWFITLDRYIVTDNPKQRGCWRVWLKHVHDDDALPNAYIRKAFGRADTPALALLLALIKALLAQGQKQ